MEQVSTSELLRRLTFDVRGSVSQLVARDAAEQKLLDGIRQDLGRVRSDFQGVEYAESGREQAEHAAMLRRRLTTLHGRILKASEYDLFDPIEVAELSTAIERIKERIGQ